MKFNSLKDIDKKVPKPGSVRHIMRQIEEDGRIVKGVNTTADVDTNSISKEAGKFGNKVDKDGRPATLSKKVKGSSTNVLFNLGMSESVLTEAVTDLGQSSEVFVDMDGVLADFFGEWQKLIGKGWRDVKGKAIEPALQAIRDKDDFWLSLPLTANAKPLLNLIKDVKGSYTILSAPLAGDKKAEPHKREWIKKNLSFFPPKNIIITADKQKYATQSDGTPNILIDDFGSNISKWEASGGVGFKHKDHKFERTAKNIKQHMQQPATERELTKGEEKKKEKNVKGMKKNKADFEKRYGKDAEAVMYATATKMAKEGTLIPNPKNTILSKSDTAYDFLKLGVNMANIKDVNPDDMNNDEPDVMLQFYGGDREKVYMMKQLKRLGYKVQDADGYKDAHYDENYSEDPNAYRLIIGLIPENFAKDSMTSIKLIKKYQQTGKDEDAFAAIKHGWNFIKNPKMRSIIVNLVKKVSTENGYPEWNDTVAYIKKNTGIDVSNVNENFADGKKKGKSRPGRVKRSGASCNGSVTALRKRAKNSSGEKAKMYHWCANMKGGKKK